jgi:hypothetical protein
LCTNGLDSRTRQNPRQQLVNGKYARAAQQPFMFHYRLYGLAFVRPERNEQEDLANN